LNFILLIVKNAIYRVSWTLLAAKWILERIFEQKYPMKKHGDQEDYAYAFKRLKCLYIKENHDHKPWYDFQKLHFGDLLRQRHEERNAVATEI